MKTQFHGSAGVWRCIMGLMVITLGAGCQFGRKPPPGPLVAPPAMLRVDHYSGSAVSGPTDRPISATTPDRAWHVSVVLVAFERATPAIGEPIGARAQMIAATRGFAPVMPSSKLTRSTRWIDLKEGTDPIKLLEPQAGRSAAMLQLQTALVPGVTVGIEAADRITRPDPAGGVIPKRRFELRLHRTDEPASGKLQVGLVVEDFVAPPRPFGPPEERAGPTAQPAKPTGLVESVEPVFTREVVIVDLDPPGATGTRFAVMLPIRFEGAEAQCVVAVVEVSAGVNTPAHRQAVDAMMAGVARSVKIAATRPSVASVGIDSGSAMTSALAALAVPNRRRPALAFLAGNTRAQLCQNVALVADENTLEQLCTSIGGKGLAATVPWNDETLGWMMESTTFQMLGRLLSEGQITPELTAVLTAYAGQAGRSAASIEELSKGLGSRQAFENRLLAENLLFLEDAQPAARVRAFDWLNSRNRAPAKYDPLGPPRERRAALENAFSAPTSAPAGGQP